MVNIRLLDAIKVKKKFARHTFAHISQSLFVLTLLLKKKITKFNEKYLK